MWAVGILVIAGMVVYLLMKKIGGPEFVSLKPAMPQPAGPLHTEVREVGVDTVAIEANRPMTPEEETREVAKAVEQNPDKVVVVPSSASSTGTQIAYHSPSITKAAEMTGKSTEEWLKEATGVSTSGYLGAASTIANMEAEAARLRAEGKGALAANYEHRAAMLRKAVEKGYPEEVQIQAARTGVDPDKIARRLGHA